MSSLGRTKVGALLRQGYAMLPYLAPARIVLIFAAGCWLAAGAHSGAAAEPPGRSMDAACRLTEAAGCNCSFAHVETMLTFGEAAALILGYYQAVPYARYTVLLDRLLRQCAGEADFPEDAAAVSTSAGLPPARTAWRP